MSLSELRLPYNIGGHSRTVYVKRIIVSDSVICLNIYIFIITTKFILIRAK